ncbi:carbohydrate ABC transporter permease [Pseudoroseicyclus tamaricis]|uniref:Sugar ABC transporter permease n=1 Tax=Pseudoroseicyclus tamaricis TaxID=2705421 RepID=A0A6B2JI89_9RHOB|nr:sugar ABC transporter permease [Pseudoroseicyclus tamaricis]NDV01073.1 sugar ABC transporter permease [Pseudoroseicyclus tamaricis]
MSLIERYGMARLGAPSDLWHRTRRALRQHWPYYLMVLPVVAYFVLFLFWPTLQGLIISFQKWGLMGPQGWVGFENYEKVFSDRTVLRALRNTLVISAGITVLGVFLPILPALALIEITPQKARQGFQTVIYAPYLMSWVIIVGLWLNTLSPIGLVNSALLGLGVIDQPIPFLTSRLWGQPLVIGLTTWKDIGFLALIYYAALMSLDQEILDAASLDGAGPSAKIRHIILPHLAPVMRVVFFLTLLGSLRTFDSALLLMNGRTADTVRTLAVFTYERGILRFDLGFASAAGVLLLGISLAFLALSRLLPGVRGGIG